MGCVLSTRPGGHQTTSSDRTASNAGSLVMRGRLREAANAAIMGSWSSGIGELGKVGQPSESKAQVRRSPAPRTTWRISSTIARGCGIGSGPGARDKRTLARLLRVAIYDRVDDSVRQTFHCSAGTEEADVFTDDHPVSTAGAPMGDVAEPGAAVV